MKRILTAFAVAGSLGAAAPVAAEDRSAGMAMDVALSMLELSAERELRMHGITDVDVMGLTLDQLTAIRFATESDDEQGLRQQRLRQIVSAN